MVMCSDTVVEWVRLPLVPVMVMVNVPVGVPPAAPVKVSVEVPDPPVTLAGLKLALTPVGNAPVDSETVPVNPPVEVMVMVVVAEPLLGIVRLEGDALMLKSPVPGALTVRV